MPTTSALVPDPNAPNPPFPAHNDLPATLWAPALAASAVAAMIALHYMFNMPVLEVALSVVLALLVAVLAVRALGETDLNPVSGIGKLTQAVFATVAPGKVLNNLVAGAASEAAAQQAGDMMQVRSRPTLSSTNGPRATWCGS